MDAASPKKLSAAAKKGENNSRGEQRNHRVGGERPLFVLSSCEIRDSLKHSMERKHGIPSAWLTGVCLLGWDKALLSPCPSPA